MEESLLRQIPRRTTRAAAAITVKADQDCATTGQRKRQKGGAVAVWRNHRCDPHHRLDMECFAWSGSS